MKPAEAKRRTLILLEVVLEAVGRDARGWTVDSSCCALMRPLCTPPVKDSRDIWGLTRFAEKSILYDIGWIEDDAQADAIIIHEVSHAFSQSGHCADSYGEESPEFAAAHKIAAGCYLLLFTEGEKI